jgi:hypothetical protein
MPSRAILQAATLIKDTNMRRVFSAMLLMALAVSASGCVAACRPGHVGPYGGVHPGGCAVY